MTRKYLLSSIVASAAIVTVLSIPPAFADPGHDKDSKHNSSSMMQGGAMSSGMTAGASSSNRKNMNMHSGGSNKSQMMDGKFHSNMHSMMNGHGMSRSVMGGLGYIHGGHSKQNHDKNFSADDVSKILAGRLAWNGNKRLKVGKVTEKSENTYVAEIVTIDNSLVEMIEVDRKTGKSRISR
jgi:hypothetical protein